MNLDVLKSAVHLTANVHRPTSVSTNNVNTFAVEMFVDREQNVLASIIKPVSLINKIQLHNLSISK